MKLIPLLSASLLALVTLPPAPAATALWERGYSVIPTPQRVQLTTGTVIVDDTWRVTGVTGGIAFRSLLADMESFHQTRLKAGTASGKVIHLAVRPGTVPTGNDAAIARQGYRLEIRDNAIRVTGNAKPGLFYGVQTLLQLLKRDSAGRLVAPLGVIEDWPRFQLRFLHWDTKHHQNRMETLKRYLDWSARFKVNMIGFELEDKFAYPSHPSIGAPGAYTPAELQEIVNYGLERHIQVVPQVQTPAHMAYVLKHPEFDDLKADGNNYQSSVCDPRTYDLIFSMFDDLIAATKGVEYFFVSTDEYYYAGIDARCGKPYNEENRSLQWVEFANRAHKYLAKRGRKMLAWVEYPVLPQHIKLLPPDLIDGVVGAEEYLKWENKLGIRQLGYVSMQGSEYLFPNHLPLETGSGVTTGRLEAARERIAHGRHMRGNPIGVFGAAWDDSGLHDETFWLGWSAVAQYAWNPSAAPVEQHVAEFMRLYYGPRVVGMSEIYRSMERQARAWQASWDRVVSTHRGPGYGNSNGKGIGTTRHDLTLKAPPVPRLSDLTLQASFRQNYDRFLSRLPARMIENDRLLLALESNLGRADRNHYNLEVFLSLARFMGHHWQLLSALSRAEDSLLQANKSAQANKPSRAVGQMVAAYTLVDQVRKQGETVFSQLKKTYEKSRYPKGRSVNGRKFFHALDDTKDHWADRTADLSFMMVPERSIGLDKWLADLSKLIRTYAARHNVPVKGLAEARLEE